MLLLAMLWSSWRKGLLVVVQRGELQPYAVSVSRACILSLCQESFGPVLEVQGQRVDSSSSELVVVGGQACRAFLVRGRSDQIAPAESFAVLVVFISFSV